VTRLVSATSGACLPTGSCQRRTERGPLRLLDRERDAVAHGCPGDRSERLLRASLLRLVANAVIGRRRGGAGLGLTICRRLCERMGGSISVVSAHGRGITFAVELPLRPAL